MFQFSKKDTYQETNGSEFTSKLEPLTPANLEKDSYYNALNWAIFENEDTTNIAITGSYGSGKSSVIHSFVRNKKREKAESVKELFISLATFESTDTNDLLTTNEEETDFATKQENKIEQAILKQMFYQVDDKEIPYSRFKKIEHPNNSAKLLTAIYHLVLLLPILFFFFPTIGNTTFFDANSSYQKNVLALASFISLLGAFYFWLQRSHKYQLKKFGLTKGEIEFAEKSPGSVFNQNLDEIIYFFECTKKNLVVFEDLDRFNNTRIFTELREINQLINARKDLDVTFVYVVRDDLFSGTDRTKFFDFILPIVPFISASNASGQLIQLAEKKRLTNEISIDFIESITLHIKDMRMLKNCLNEYLIYRQQLHLDKKEQASEKKMGINSDHLFAMIIYKNLMPEDFALLHQNQGYVWQVFDNKKQHLQAKTEKLQSFIDLNDSKVSELSKESLENLQELNTLVVYEFLKRHERFSYFNSQNQNIGLDELVNKNGIEDAKNEEYYWEGGRQRHVKSEYTIGEICSSLNYYIRKQKLTNKKRELVTQYQQENQQLQQNITDLNHMSLSDMLLKYGDDDSFKIKQDNEEKENTLPEPVQFMLREGYINEQYHRYLSYFHPDVLTINDEELIRAILDNRALTDVTHRVDNINLVVKRLNEKRIKSLGALNFNLLEYILTDKAFAESLSELFFDNYIELLAKGHEQAWKLFREYCYQGSERWFLIKRLSDHTRKIWALIIEYSRLDNETLRKLLKHFVDIYSPEQLAHFNYKGAISKFINSDMNQIDVFRHKEEVWNFSDEIRAKETLQYYGTLQISYKELPTGNTPEDVKRFIARHGFFEINETMLQWAYEVLGGGYKCLCRKSL